MESGSDEANGLAKQAETSPATTIFSALSELEHALTAMKVAVTNQRIGLGNAPTAGQLRKAIEVRKRRSIMFGPDLFSDAAWEILIELYACALERRDPTISEVTLSVEVPGTTVLRWLDRLDRHSLLARRDDPNDIRKVRVRLSDYGKAQMDQYFRESADWFFM